MAGSSQSRRPREGGIHHQGRILKVESAPLWVDFCPRYVLEAHGTSPVWTPLEDAVGLPR